MAGSGASPRDEFEPRGLRPIHRARLGLHVFRSRGSVTWEEQAAEQARREAERVLLDERQWAVGVLHRRLMEHEAARRVAEPHARSDRDRHVSSPPYVTPGSNEGAVLFLNVNQSRSGWVDERRLPRAYVLACRVLRCSILDRTGSLEQGFTYEILDPIPPCAADPGSFGELCDRMGEQIVDEAIRDHRRISMLWSGGIDSTAALIALIRAARRRACPDRILVLLSAQSVEENPRFFRDHISGQFPIRLIAHPVPAFLDPSDLNVTGEHGDQLFGSHLLEPYVRRGIAHLPHREVLPFVLAERLKGIRSARRVERYLAPVIEAAPVRIESLFDYFWWCNFALKWQEVTLRLTAFRAEDAGTIYASLRHFFRDGTFQQWALANTPGRPVPVWRSYKEEAKRYIRAFTSDEDYYRHKEKEDSLRHVMSNQPGNSQVFVTMHRDFKPTIRSVDTTGRNLVSLLTGRGSP